MKIRGWIVVLVSFLLSSCYSKKELFSYAYHFNHIELKLIEITKKDGYYLIKGISEGDTLSLISKGTNALVRVNKNKRQRKELKVNEFYEFDLLEIYKPRDFGGLVKSEEIDSLIKGDYSSKEHWGPKYFRVLERYDYEK